MTRKTYFIFIALLLLISKNCFAQECPEYVEPEIIVTPIIDPIKTDNTKSIIDLMRLTGKKGPDKNGKMSVVSGLTVYLVDTRAKVKKVNSVSMEDGEVCAQIAAYEVSMRMISPTVYVVSEIPYDSCAYHEVMEHEQKHVEDAYTMLYTVLPSTEGYIREFLAHQGVIRARTKKEANKVLREGIDNYFEELKASISGVFEILRAQVDTEEEYSEVSRACIDSPHKIVQRAINKPDFMRRFRQ